MNLSLIRFASIGSRGSKGRLFGIGGGVAFGTLLLVLIAGIVTGLARHDARGSWLYSGGFIPDFRSLMENPQSDDAVIVGHSSENFRRNYIDIIYVAAPPLSKDTVPGVSRPPLPGEYFASAALERLIAKAPQDELGQRYGRQIGTIDSSLMDDESDLMAVVGVKKAALGFADFPTPVNSSHPGTGLFSYLLQRALGVVAVALTLPVIVLIGMFSKLGAADRNERLATLRLIGATSSQVAGMAGYETAMVSGIGSIVGAGLAQALSPLIAKFPIAGIHLVSSDMALGVFGFLSVAAGMTLVCSLATVVGVLLLGVSPLGSSRHMREAKPSAIRGLPLALGLVVLVVALNNHGTSLYAGIASVAAIAVGFLLCSIGVITAGPWLTYYSSRFMAKYAQSSAALIAAGRIASTPASIYRAASGLVLTIYLLSFLFAFHGPDDNAAPRIKAASLPNDVIAISTTSPALKINAEPQKSVSRRPSPRDIQQMMASLGDAETNPQLTPDLAKPGALQHFVAELRKVSGVTGVVTTYTVPGRHSQDKIEVIPIADAAALGLRSVATPANYETMTVDSYVREGANGDPNKAVTLTPDYEARLIPSHVIAVTDGSPASMDRVQTSIDRTFQHSIKATSRSVPDLPAGERLGAGLVKLFRFVVVLIIFVAGCSLAVAAMVGMIDRKRVFGLLRLVGMPVSELRRIVVLEAVVPLAACALFAAVTGFGVASIFMGAIAHDFSFRAPSPEYFALVGSGLAMSSLVIIFTAQMVRKNTSVVTTRFE